MDTIRKAMERIKNLRSVLESIANRFPTPTYKYIYRIYAEPPTPTMIADVFFNKLTTNINI
jgi:hypothetical protein